MKMTRAPRSIGKINLVGLPSCGSNRNNTNETITSARTGAQGHGIHRLNIKESTIEAGTNRESVQ
jgi:hypothetical protein